jgi:hypothetical protein
MHTARSVYVLHTNMTSVLVVQCWGSLVYVLKQLQTVFSKYFFGGFFLFCSVQYSALLHLPPLRFHCADGCWDRTQDRCNWCIGSQTL